MGKSLLTPGRLRRRQRRVNSLCQREVEATPRRLATRFPLFGKEGRGEIFRYMSKLMMFRRLDTEDICLYLFL